MGEFITQRGSFRALLSVLFIIWSCVGWTYVPVTDNNLISSADSIVLGKVVANIDGSQSGINGPWTHYQVELNHILKSSDALKKRMVAKRNIDGADSIVVSVIGGYDSNTDRTLFVSAAPTYEIGDNVLFFLSHDTAASGEEVNQVAHFALGSFQKIQVPTNDVAPLRSNERESDFVLIRNFDLDQLANLDSEQKDSEISVRKYADFVRYIVRTLMVHEPDSEQRIQNYWTTMKSGAIAERQKARFNTFTFQKRPIRWKSFDNEIPVTWHRHVDGQTGIDGGAEKEFRSGLDAWNNQPNTPISYIDGDGTNAQTAFISADGINSIVFNDPKNVISGTYKCGVGGTLALGGWWTSGKQYTFRGIEFAELVEADIVVQDGIDCWFKSTSDPSASYANLMAHELGHTLGLDHSCGDSNQKCIVGTEEDNSVMRAHVHNNKGAVLGDDDNKGIEYIYSECYPDCPYVPLDSTYGLEEQELQQDSNDDTFLGLDVKHSIIVGCVVLFALVMTIAIVIIFVVIKKRRQNRRETVRSRSSSLIIDPYDHIDISFGPPQYISPTRLSYYDHFKVVSNLQQQQQQSNGVTSPYRMSKPFPTINLTVQNELIQPVSLDDQKRN